MVVHAFNLSTQEEEEVDLWDSKLSQDYKFFLYLFSLCVCFACMYVMCNTCTCGALGVRRGLCILWN